MSYSWFKKGTCTATNGSARVNFFGANITTAPNKPEVGDAFMIDFSTLYEVTFIGSDSTGEYILLDREFGEATASNAKYAMMRLASSTQNAALVAKASAAINQKQISLNNMFEWYTSAADTVDFSDVDGTSTAVPTYSKLLKDISSIGGSADAIKVVADNIDEVKAVATNAGEIATVGANMPAIMEVNANISAITTVNSNKDHINAVAGSIQNIDAVANNSANIDIVAANISGVNDVGSNIQAVLNVTAQVSHVDSQVRHVDQQVLSASASASSATASKDSAEQFKNKADQFANAAFDVDVEPGKKSAFHWSEQARINANQTFVSGGIFKPQKGNEYPDVSAVVRDTIWIIDLGAGSGNYTFEGGDLAGKVTKNGDQLFYDTPHNTFSLISVSSSGILSIDGITDPNVNLESKYFWSGNLPSISDVTGLSADLASKFSAANKPSISDVTGLTTELSSKFSSLNRPAVSDVVDLQTDLNSKFSSTNKPTISDVTNLSTELSGKLGSSDNAVSATKLQTQRGVSVNLSGDASGSASAQFDGTQDITLDITVAVSGGTGGGGSTVFKPYIEGTTTVVKNEAYYVDISDDVSKNLPLPALANGDQVGVMCHKATGLRGVFVNINFPVGGGIKIEQDQVAIIQMVDGVYSVVGSSGVESALVIPVNNGNPIGVNETFEIDIRSVLPDWQDGEKVNVWAEVYNDGSKGGTVGWGKAPVVYLSGSYGLSASNVNSKIIIATGVVALLAQTQNVQLHPFGDLTGRLTSAKCQVVIQTNRQYQTKIAGGN